MRWINANEEPAVDYRWLAVVGMVVGVLFAVALVGLARSYPWGVGLVAGLSAVDLVGEFVAQGTLAITITVSFVVALITLVLGLRALRRTRAPTGGLTGDALPDRRSTTRTG